MLRTKGRRMYHMRSRTLLLALLALSVLPLSAIGADIDAKWKAQVKANLNFPIFTKMGQIPTYDGKFADIYFTFKSDEKELTGTVSSIVEGEHQISKGKIKGDKISFTIEIPGPPIEMPGPADASFDTRDTRYEYTGKIKGHEITLTRLLVFRGSFKDNRNILKNPNCDNGYPDMQSIMRRGARSGGPQSWSMGCPPTPKPEKLVLTRVAE
jgi:hypothetical protein